MKAARGAPCLEVAQEVQMGVFQEAGTCQNRRGEEVAHAGLGVEEVDVLGHFRDEGEEVKGQYVVLYMVTLGSPVRTTAIH